jgi:hypothetical protein
VNTLTPVAIAAGLTSPLLKRLHGWSLRETAGTAVVVQIRDGASGGQILASFTVPASGESKQGPGPGIQSSKGLFVVLTGAGTLEGSIYGS